MTDRTSAALTVVGLATQEAWTPFIGSTPLPEMTGSGGGLYAHNLAVSGEEPQ